jgi:hypothetical protein
MARRNRSDIQWVVGGMVLLVAMLLTYRVSIDLRGKQIALEPSPTATVQQLLKQEDVEPIFDDFIKSWNNKDYRRQLNNLTDDFRSTSYDSRTGLSYESYDYDEYELLKKNIFRKYDWIEVKATNVKFYLNPNNVSVVRYSQHYNSPAYESWGTNELYFRREGNKVKIFKEIFYRDRYVTK